MSFEMSNGLQNTSAKTIKKKDKVQKGRKTPKLDKILPLSKKLIEFLKNSDSER